MHIVPFRLKRAYQSALAQLRRAAKPYGITPARYDLLYLIGDGYKPQSAIHKALGVTRATTSRMLISLERLKLIERFRPYRTRRHLNRRSFMVQLTDEGRRILRAVRNSIIAPAMQLAFESYFLTWGMSPWSAFLQVDTLISTLLGIAKYFGDTAEFLYPAEEPDSGPDPNLPIEDQRQAIPHWSEIPPLDESPFAA